MSKGKPEYVGGQGGGGFALRPKMPDLPFKVPRWTIPLAIIFVILLIAYVTCLEYVRPNEFGIKEIQIGSNRGIQERVYAPGYVLVMPFGMQVIHRLPRNVQVLEMTRSGSQGHPAASVSGALVNYIHPAKIQTSDGFFVDVDVTILYRIIDPYRVVTSLGPRNQYYTQGILPQSEPYLKTALGQLTTEEFYNSPLRAEKAELARELLDAQMSEWGIRVEHVLIRYFEYTPSIQENIEAKKLEDQLVFTNQSERRAASEQQLLNRVVAEGKAEVEVTRKEGEAYVVRRKAEQDLYSRSKKAEANLLVELAEAHRTALKNEAMESAGVDRKVAMAMAEVLEGLEVIMLPGGGEDAINPLNLQQMIQLFGVGSDGTPSSETSSRIPRLPASLTAPPVESISGVSEDNVDTLVEEEVGP